MSNEAHAPDDGLTRDERFHAQTTAQYAALGRFVQAFEEMIRAIRIANTFLLGGNLLMQQRHNVLLHHQAMTAWPLFQVMRSLYGVRVQQMGSELDPEELRVLNEALRYLSTEIQSLINMRNTLLHGTWAIGWVSQDQEDFSQLDVFNFQVRSSGIELAETPKSVTELDAITQRCAEAGALVQKINVAFTAFSPPRVRFNIHQVGKVWVDGPVPK